MSKATSNMRENQEQMQGTVGAHQRFVHGKLQKEIPPQATVVLPATPRSESGRSSTKGDS